MKKPLATKYKGLESATQSSTESKKGKEAEANAALQSFI